MARRRPFRYTLILVGVALSAVLAAAGGWRYARASAPLNGPIVVISIDTLRADHLPTYGYKKVKTPALDLLAADGVTFEHAYAHAPESLPAHIAFLSGRLPFETGMRGRPGDRLRPGERLLPQMLHDRGYTTGGIVSASVLGRETGIAQGFDFFDAEMPPAELLAGAEVGERDGAESERIAEHWLDSAGTSRAFLFLHLAEPHAPYSAPERFSDLAPYDAEIAYADEVVGRLIKYLKGHQLYDRSTIVLLSDHGEGLGDHGETEHGLFVYGETMRVPLIVKQEGNEGAGRRVADVVQHIDLVPTILDLVKAPIPGALRGRSLKPLLEGRGPMPDRLVYSEALYARTHFGWSELTAITDSRYRYIRAPHEELYDLTSDPRERVNLLDADSAKASSPAVLKTRAAMNAELQRLLPPPDQSGAAAPEPAPDPKDKREFVETYRQALHAASQHQWSHAIDLLQQILRVDPDVAEPWNTLAGLAVLTNRYDLARSAFGHVVVLRPADPSGYLGAADVFFRERRLDDARTQALAAIDAAADSDSSSRARAHELLTRVALARRDAEQARLEAGLAHQLDATSLMPAFADARLLYDQGKYEDALPGFEEAVAKARKAGGQPLENLHFYAGDTFQRLYRPSEAEYEFLEELRAYPHNLRAVASLVSIYQSQERRDEAEETLTRVMRNTPTAESYALAARLLKALGNNRRATAVRAEAAHMFADARPRPTSH